MNVINRETLPLLSFIVGLGIAIIVSQKSFQVKPTLPMSVSEMEGKIIESDGKCYTYHAEDTECEILTSK
jgi:hypothetical protein